MSRFEELVETVADYQKRAGEHYDRVRGLAENLRQGFCEYLGSGMGTCVHLVPPAGAFKPTTDLNTAFSIPARGFRPLGPIAFGMAVRVSKGTDWIRVVMVCYKRGEKFTVEIDAGPSYTFGLPLADNSTDEFYDILYAHISGQFTEAITRYDRGNDARSIGFYFSEDAPESTGLS